MHLKGGAKSNVLRARPQSFCCVLIRIEYKRIFRNAENPPSTALPETQRSTLMPFPPVMPGASFYVDQHVSHGHYGRETLKALPNVVYDPNVLERFYS